jgi:REP element-mobilizing transposase RayT
MYLRLLQKYAGQHGLAVWAYCLMTNHVHLVAVPEREQSLGRALRDAHTVYADSLFPGEETYRETMESDNHRDACCFREYTWHLCTC